MAEPDFSERYLYADDVVMWKGAAAVVFCLALVLLVVCVVLGVPESLGL